jgi:hypothetical protein
MITNKIHSFIFFVVANIFENFQMISKKKRNHVGKHTNWLDNQNQNSINILVMVMESTMVHCWKRRKNAEKTKRREAGEGSITESSKMYSLAYLAPDGVSRRKKSITLLKFRDIEVIKKNRHKRNGFSFYNKVQLTFVYFLISSDSFQNNVIASHIIIFMLQLPIVRWRWWEKDKFLFKKKCD